MSEPKRAGKTTGATESFVAIFEMMFGRHEAFEVSVTRAGCITAVALRGAMPSSSLEDLDEILGRIVGLDGKPLRCAPELFALIETMLGDDIEQLGTVYVPPAPAFALDPIAGPFPCGSFARYVRHYRLIDAAGPAVMELARRNRVRHPDAPPATIGLDTTTLALS